MNQADLSTMARRIRRHVLTMSHRAQAPHVASAFSCVELLVWLYFEVARFDSQAPDSPVRDHIILSKGHAAAALYAVLAARGVLPPAALDRFAVDGSELAEHPSRSRAFGIETTSGSLGAGLGIGAGLALAARLAGRENQVYVVLSDGECNEGSVWEAAAWAPAQDLGNLTAIVDSNGWQATGRSAEITALEPLPEKWRAFGWSVAEVEGHDFPSLREGLARLPKDRPRALVARTTKGKGVSFMENNLEWHYRPPGEDDLARALAELEADDA